MFRFPYYGYPFFNYYNKYNSFNHNINYQMNQKKEDQKNSITNFDKISNTINSYSFDESEQAIFEIFGIKLYLDDLIILCLLFFLYQQKVNDEILYIILFLLLFS